MTSIALHAPPEPGDVWRAQVRATWLAASRPAFVYLAVLVLALIAATVATIRWQPGSPGTDFEITPGFGSPMVLLGLLVPLTVWRSDEPAQRAYHLAMPIEQSVHTWMKVGAGWLWLMAGVAAYCLLVAGTVVGAVLLAGADYEPQPTWVWVIPFTAATVSYLLSSVLAVATNRPGLWLLLLALGFPLLLPLFDGLDLELLERAMGSVLTGRYGFATAVQPAVDRTNAIESSWLAALALWLVLGAAGVAAAARLRR